MIHRLARTPLCLPALALLFGGVLTNQANAQLLVTGQVYPADNPFTDDLEGLYGAVDLFVFDPQTTEQTRWERDRNVSIGLSSFGTVRLSQGAFLNFQHIVLGGSENEVDPASIRNGPGDGDIINGLDPASPITGNGLLWIDDPNTFYNNHPKVIPAEYQDIFYGGAEDELLFPTTNTRPQAIGFDAYVGLTGTGELRITDGGRAEIQDAVIVGFGPTSVGRVLVDGVGSYLAAYGGLNPNGNTVDGVTMVDRDEYATGNDMGIHQMIIGAYGYAEMNITNGGYVDALRGAAIGVTKSDGDDDLTDNTYDDADSPQGEGRVIVDGAGSTWNIVISAFDNDDLPNYFSNQGGALAIGEFLELPAVPDYGHQHIGTGYLSIRNNALVNVDRYIRENNPYNDPYADVRIGLMGTLDFQGGRMIVRDQVVSDGLIQAIDPGETQPLGPTTRVSHLSFATFENRTLGRMKVGAGQTLAMRSTAPTNYFAPDTPDPTQPYVAANFGEISVRGDGVDGRAVLSYDRQYDGAISTMAFASRAERDPQIFWNAANTTAPGRIIAKDSELNFRNGLWNSGELLFVGGENIVNGPVMNDTDGFMAPRGIIGIANSSTVVFEDSVTNDGTIAVSDDSSVVFLNTGVPAAADAYRGTGDLNLITTGDAYVGGDFALGDVSSQIGGTLRLYVEEFATGAFSHMLIDGDADFDFFNAAARIEIFGNIMNPVNVGDVLELITVLGTANFGSAVIDAQALSTAPGTVVVAETSASGLQLVVASLVGLPGDFNNDGMVNASDYTLWRDNLGAPDESAINFNGDGGGITASDYDVWVMNYGDSFTPLAESGVVPEPSALAALLAGVALAGFRRRAA